MAGLSLATIVKRLDTRLISAHEDEVMAARMAMVKAMAAKMVMVVAVDVMVMVIIITVSRAVEDIASRAMDGVHVRTSLVTAEIKVEMADKINRRTMATSTNNRTTMASISSRTSSNPMMDQMECSCIATTIRI